MRVKSIVLKSELFLFVFMNFLFFLTENINFVGSSGTSGGKQKWIPKTAEEGERRAFICCLRDTVLNR